MPGVRGAAGPGRVPRAAAATLGASRWTVFRRPDEPEVCARYRITRERVRYCGQVEPYIALRWADPPPPCSCGA
ncbi:hypothetical protein GCM10020216_094900 [Nonomuraea helvata]